MRRCRSAARLFWLLATPPERTLVRHNAIRILVWLCGSAVFWLLGGFAEGQARLWFWAVALAIEYVSPAVRFWTPGLGFSSVQAWAVEGGHMAERCAGFIIIALGEAVVVNAATFADLAWTHENVTAFVSAFVSSIAMWWIYFHKGAEAGSEMISKSAESGRVARLAYTYLHMPIVGGIILTAVADEVVLKHPAGHSDLRTLFCAVGGPLLFLVGTILFKHAIREFLPAFPHRRHRCLRRARLVRGRHVAIAAVDRDDGVADRGRDLGIAVAEVESGNVGCGCSPAYSAVSA